ncbi:MAG: recombinase family protein [Anaerocolumna aminovalerica]|uniref:recombinase family protein n=1 Tax=Anaerocolumna aminovalerica TaxID=1527 RepID=UPI0029091DDF|nr:recombinase family protein [Anaerocolumna aminovalerica]MDU6264324.1 recombinase family protein [Anaerocolumna aminovalerica]
MEKKVIAIYARKSKATDKGESLQVQIEKCKQLARFKYSDFKTEFIIYEEQEGKTGANLDREKFKELMGDITSGSKPIHILLVYKLDRLTRSVQDFTEIYEILNAHGTEFISVKEDFDTTTPMGRAMLTITVVFAQLEREVIAERIQDSMLELAKRGRWLGGKTPFAYESKLTSYINHGGQEKKKNYLEIVPGEAEIIEKIFANYLELGSLSKVEAYLLKHLYKTRSDSDFRRYSIKFILANPVYCKADLNAYEYFIKNGYSIYSPKETFDGEHGIMAYNKTLSVKYNDTNLDMKESRWRKKEDWVIAVGEHKPLVESGDWIKVQKMLDKNKEKSYRASRTTDALLSGVLKCKCGHPMRPKTSGTRNSEGEKSFYYLCEMKERSKGARCKECNLAGNILDKIIIKKITELEKEIAPIFNKALFRCHKRKEDNRIFSTARDSYIRNQIDKTKRYLNNIKKAILKATTEEAIADFIEEYQVYLEELKQLEISLEDTIEEEVMEYGEEEWVELLTVFDKIMWKELSYEQRKYAVKELIEEIYWNGGKVEVFFKGSNLSEKC